MLTKVRKAMLLATGAAFTTLDRVEKVSQNMMARGKKITNNRTKKTRK